LIRNGFDPQRPLLVYRKGTLAIRIRSIREGAALEVDPQGTGFIAFRGLRPASPVRKSAPPQAISAAAFENRSAGVS
jgi:hypothetical protein